jgi:hypothetical protein
MWDWYSGGVSGIWAGLDIGTFYGAMTYQRLLQDEDLDISRRYLAVLPVLGQRQPGIDTAY